MQSTRTLLEGFFFQNTEAFTGAKPGNNVPYTYTDATIVGNPNFYFSDAKGNTDSIDLSGVINRAADISLNLTRFKQEFKYLNEQSGVYGDDILDASGNPLHKNIKSLTEARKSDGQIMLVQQNTMYIIGIITTATILITAIMIAK